MISLPSMISSFYTYVKEDLQGNTKVERLVLCKLFHCFFWKICGKHCILVFMKNCI